MRADECRFTVEDALARLPGPAGERFTSVLERGTLQVELYAPVGTDPQQPHARDELYIIVRGSGVFLNGGVRQWFSRGDLLFVPAGREHRFEAFTEDLVTWVIFYGPEGGDAVDELQESDLKIRTATNLDGERIRALVFRTLEEFGLKPDPQTTDADLNDIETSYNYRGGLFEVIEDESGKLLGTAGLYRLDDETCELRKMYFAPELRGRGMGRLMLGRTMSRARALGYKRMTLETASVLKKAIKLYTRFGFKPFDSGHKSARSDQSYFLDL
jgi:putative acetyltransferase